MNAHNSQTNLNRNQLQEQERPGRKYRKTNAYTQKASFEQIFTVSLFVIITILHAVFITSAAGSINSSILWVLVGFTYGLLVLIGYDYCYLTCMDPADDLLLKIKRHYKNSELMFCRDCNSEVHFKSYHCNRCNRCVEYFDHHCKYLNNCIGGKNYHPFLRMLISVTIFCLSIIFSAIWVFVVDSNDQTVSVLSRWGAMVTLILTVVALLAVDSLLCFHFYLIFVLKTTTLNYIMNTPDSQPERPEYPN